MPDSPSIQPSVLFVDDDLSFLQMIRDVFGSASHGAWNIQTANSGDDALPLLRKNRMDLVVIDVFMPGMDGLQLLRVLDEEFPSLPKVLLTGMPDPNTRAAAIEGGAALFLEKPASAAGYESVFATLNELLRWHQRFSSRGALRRLRLLDIVKLECMSGNSRLFEVFAGDVHGEIFVKEGVVIHATMPDRRGQSAFTSLTTAPGAVYYLRQYVEPVERSVDRQWEFLYMEAAQVLTQLAEAAALGAAAEEGKSAEPPAATEALKMAAPMPPPKEPASAAPAPVAVPLPEVSAHSHVLKPVRPPPTRLETAGADGLKLAEAPDALPIESVGDPGGFKVEEVMLCAEFREVLHASNYASTTTRMRLAEALAQKAHMFATQLPLGELERVELNSTGGRMVIRYEANRCLLVRTNTKGVQPAGDSAATEIADEWLARLPVVRGVLAAAVLTKDGRLHHRSFVPDYSADVSQVVAREAAGLLDLALKHGFSAWMVRILFAHSQLYVFRRQDGMVFCALLLRSGADKRAVERISAEFANVCGT